MHTFVIPNVCDENLGRCFRKDIHSFHRCWYPREGRGLPSRSTQCARITSPILYSSRPGRGSASGEIVNRSS